METECIAADSVAHSEARKVGDHHRFSAATAALDGVDYLEDAEPPELQHELTDGRRVPIMPRGE